MTLGIVGIGLIGGSLAKDLKHRGWASETIGFDANEESLQRAVDLGLITRKAKSLDEVMQKADVIGLAIPVNAMETVLIKAMDLCRHEQIVFDVGSTKSDIVDRVNNHDMRPNFVATHPMAGTEYSGPEAAHLGLFQGKSAVICNAKESHSKAVAVIENMYKALGMNIVYHQAENHDIHSAYVSHISHISSFALALTVLEKEKDEDRIFELASGGFSSTVRLAKSKAETWVPIFEKNRDNVLDVLDEHINIISKFRTLLIKKDFDTFYKLINQANQIEKIIK